MPKRIRLDISIATYPHTRKLAPIAVGPVPYGMAPNIRSIDALKTAAFKQGLPLRLMEIDEQAVDPEAQ